MIQPNFDRLPEPIQPMMADYVGKLDAALPGLVDAVYVHGSIALGAFVPHSSDVDFITVLTRRADAAEIERLAEVHQHITATYQWGMDGSYLQRDDLGQITLSTPYPHYNEGFNPAADSEASDITWWTLKHHGIAVVGQNPAELAYAVDWDGLIDRMRENLNTYWRGWAYNPRRMAVLVSDWGVQWAVLGVLRQFYSFREGDITSKTGAGRYALTCVPDRWHRLIREAISIRERETERFYRSRYVRAWDTVRFLRYIIATA